MLMTWLGRKAAFLCAIAVIPSLISGLGISIAMSALMASGVSALSGRVRYAVMSMAITTVNVFRTSVLAAKLLTLTGADRSTYALFIGVPYLVTFALVGIGLLIRRHRACRAADERRNSDRHPPCASDEADT